MLFLSKFDSLYDRIGVGTDNQNLIVYKCSVDDDIAATAAQKNWKSRIDTVLAEIIQVNEVDFLNLV